MNIGTFQSRKKVTAQLFMARIATPAAFTNYGNVLMYKAAHKIDRAQQITAMAGYTQLTHEEPGKVDLRWHVKCDEQHTEAIKHLFLATRGSDLAQTQTAGTAWSLTNVTQGLSYYVGAMGLTALVVTGKVLGTDYTVDLGSGMITIVPGGGIANASNPAGTFDKPALTYQQFTGLGELIVPVAVRLITKDINQANPREIITFNGEVHVSDWGDNDGQKFNEYAFELLCVNQPTIQAL